MEFQAARAFAALGGIGLDHAGDLGGRGIDHLRDLGRRRLDEADDLGPQLVERRQGGERLDPVRVERGLPHRSAKNDETLVGLGEIDGNLGRRDRIAGEGDQGRPLQQGRDRGDVAAFKSDLGEAVFRDLHARASLLHLPTQNLHLGDRKAGIMSNDNDIGGLEDLAKAATCSLFSARSTSSLRLAVPYGNRRVDAGRPASIPSLKRRTRQDDIHSLPPGTACAAPGHRGQNRRAI